MELFGLHIIKDRTYRYINAKLACMKILYEQEKSITAFNSMRITALEMECTRLKAQLDKYKVARDAKGRFKKKKNRYDS